MKGKAMKATKAVAKKASNTITLPTIDGKAPYVKKMIPKPHREEIFEYIRRRHHGKTLKVGIVLGVKVNDSVKIGWSKCNIKIGDKFDRRVGLRLALNRALISPMPKKTTVPTPKCIQRQVRAFGARCIRYFKDTNKVLIPA